MKVLALLSLVFVTGILAGEYPDENSVLVLGDDNLADAIDEFQYILVEFCKYKYGGWGNVNFIYLQP